MDDEMEDFEEQHLETDFDYEFDAPRYFDFLLGETFEEVQEAELWFQTAGSYPPSPYVAILNARGVLAETTNTYHSSNDATQETCTITHSVNGVELQVSAADSERKGCNFYNHITKVGPIEKAKSLVRAPSSRSSTLMKPTASQLAKQNQRLEVKFSSRSVQRFDKALTHEAQRILKNQSTNETQAAKRQKLEGGHLCKVPDTQQQINLTHKVPKKCAPVDGCFEQPRLKLTIPREPELVTAQRAQRMRSKNGMEFGENRPTTTSIFRARPLNRKIFEAPSLPVSLKRTPRMPEFQEFHLKTSERAMHPLSNASSSQLPGKDFDNVIQREKTTFGTRTSVIGSSQFMRQSGAPSKPQKPNVADDRKHEDSVHRFKARPLDKKIFTSKGDIGVFRTVKRATTIPMGFNFLTDKRFQQNPPTELFSKLSLASEVPQSAVSQPKLSCTPQASYKGSKENITYCLGRQGSKGTCLSKEISRSLGGKLSMCGSKGGLTEVRSRENMCR
ncbi:protein TPX2-like [Aristolochia californica]|uniref:protein TPX2-like n=1 Tax=Aristolochia californica TaxID=171875 RepID=UPI0035E0099A